MRLVWTRSWAWRSTPARWTWTLPERAEGKGLRPDKRANVLPNGLVQVPMRRMNFALAALALPAIPALAGAQQTLEHATRTMNSDAGGTPALRRLPDASLT